MMNRRGFLQAILASGVAPYICTAAGVLMPVKTIVDPFAEARRRILELLYPPDDQFWGVSMLERMDVRTKQLALNLYYRRLLVPRHFPTPKFVRPTAPSPIRR